MTFKYLGLIISYACILILAQPFFDLKTVNEVDQSKIENMDPADESLTIKPDDSGRVQNTGEDHINELYSRGKSPALIEPDLEFEPPRGWEDTLGLLKGYDYDFDIPSGWEGQLEFLDGYDVEIEVPSNWRGEIEIPQSWDGELKIIRTGPN